MEKAPLDYLRAVSAQPRAGYGVASLCFFSIWGAVLIASGIAWYGFGPGYARLILLGVIAIVSAALLPLGLLLGICGLCQKGRRTGVAMFAVSFNAAAIGAIVCLIVAAKLRLL